MVSLSKVFLTVTFSVLSILTDHDLFGSDVEQDCSYTVFAVVLLPWLNIHSFIHSLTALVLESKVFLLSHSLQIWIKKTMFVNSDVSYESLVCDILIKWWHPAALFTIFDISNAIACYCDSLKDYLKSRILLYYARFKVLCCHGPTSFSEPISHIFESATN